MSIEQICFIAVATMIGSGILGQLFDDLFGAVFFSFVMLAAFCTAAVTGGMIIWGLIS